MQTGSPGSEQEVTQPRLRQGRRTSSAAMMAMRSRSFFWYSFVLLAGRWARYCSTESAAATGSWRRTAFCTLVRHKDSLSDAVIAGGAKGAEVGSSVSSE